MCHYFRDETILLTKSSSDEKNLPYDLSPCDVGCAFYGTTLSRGDFYGR
jgi:hypothetical protein